MKKIFAILLALAMLLSLAACGGGSKDDPNLGKYIGIQGEMDGIVLTMEELYPGESYLELKSGGKAALVLEGDKVSGTWTLDGEDFNLVVEGQDCPGTLKDGVIIFDFGGSGIMLTFRKEGGSISDKLNGGQNATEPAKPTGPLGLYQGTTYEYSGQSFQMTDIYNGLCTIELLDGGKAVFILGGEEMQCTWELDGEDFILDNAAVESPGTLKDGTITIDFMGMGMMMTFVLADGNTAGSGGAENVSDIAGFYPLYAVDQDGEYTGNDIITMLGMEKENYIILNEDGTAIAVMDGDEIHCTYNESCFIEEEGYEISYAFVDGLLELYLDGNMTFYYQKGDMSDIPEKGADGASEFPEDTIEEFHGDWHGMAVVYEGTGYYEDEVDMEFEIIARLAFGEDGTCEPYLACAFSGEDNNFKSLTAEYNEADDTMILSGEFVNIELADDSNLYMMDGVLYADVYVDDGEGNYLNLYACLRRLDEEWDYENDWLALSEDAVEFYKGKDFLEIAELFQVDVDEIPELDGQSGSVEAPATEPAASGAGILDYETIAEVYDWVLDYSSAANGYGKISYEEIVERMGGVEGAETCLDLWSETTRFYKWGISEDEYIQLTFSLRDGVWVKSGATNTSAFMDIYKKYYG